MSTSSGWAFSAFPAEAAESAPVATILITRPSSPDEPAVSQQLDRSSPSLGTIEVRTLSDVTLEAPVVTPSTATPALPATRPMSLSPFEEHLAATDTPPSGPELFHVRRALWREPLQNPPAPTQPNPSRRRLENILATPGAFESDETWGAGIDRVWNGLIGGARLRHRLPLALVIKILQAGWIREGTWPRGAIPPDSDDQLDQAAVTSSGQSSVLSTTTETTPTSRTPGSTYAFNTFDGAGKKADVEVVYNKG